MPKTAIKPFVLPFVLVLAAWLGACSSEPMIDWRIASTSPAKGWEPMKLAAADTTYYVSDSSILSDADITDVQSKIIDKGLLLDIHLTPEGKSRFEKGTSSHIDDRVAIIMNSRFINAPIIKTPMTTDKITMLVPLSEADSKEMAAALTARWPKS
ncbi:MAG TPA: hypothetical protein VFK04_08510 [Gemmatimonadaceae bacterium]|nr:hypothetical protein [Gemmatimonadaceae bacterium]